MTNKIKLSDLFRSPKAAEQSVEEDFGVDAVLNCSDIAKVAKYEEAELDRFYVRIVFQNTETPRPDAHLAEREQRKIFDDIADRLEIFLKRVTVDSLRIPVDEVHQRWEQVISDIVSVTTSYPLTPYHCKALEQWPSGRIRRPDGRLENAWDYIKRVYFELDPGDEPNEQRSSPTYGTLYLFQVREINRKLYNALSSLASRNAKERYLPSKADATTENLLRRLRLPDEVLKDKRVRSSLTTALNRVNASGSKSRIEQAGSHAEETELGNNQMVAR